MSTFIKYNDIEIRNCLLRRFSQLPVYDDSGTDLLYFRFSIRVDGVIFGGSTGRNWNRDLGVWKDGGQGQSTSSATAHFVDIRAKMAEPRGRFEMVMGADTDGQNGETMFDIVHPTGAQLGKTAGYDMNNGPRCTEFMINRAASDNVFNVTAEFEVCTLECGEGGEGDDKNDTNVLSNRWTCADDIGDNFYTTRTFSGRLRLANAVANPHSFRHLVFPTLQFGMKRKRISLTSSTDGLTLDYTVTDEEVTFSPPEPATSWSYKHTESLGENGAVMNGDMQIRLAGDRYVNKKELLAVGVQLMKHKLLSIAINNRKKFILKQFSATDSAGSDQDNSVIIQCSVQHTWGGVKDNLDVAFGRWGKPPDGFSIPGYNNDLSPDLPNQTEGNISSVSAFAVFLQKPCSVDHSINHAKTKPGDKAGSPIENTKPALEVRVVDPLEDQEPDYLSDDHKTNGIYTHYQADHHYGTSEMKTALPLAETRITGSSSRVPSISISQLARPTTTLTVRVQAERQDEVPKLPAPKKFRDVRGILMTPLDHRVAPSSKDLDPVGVPVYRVNAEYVFAMERAPEPDEQEFNIGNVPWIAGGDVDKTSQGFLDGKLGDEE